MIRENILEYSEGLVNAMAVSPSGEILAVANQDHTVWLQKIPSGDILLRLGGHERALDAVAYSPDGQLLAARSRDGLINLWKIQTTTYGNLDVDHQDIFRNDGNLGILAFTLDGHKLVTGNQDNKINFWDVGSRRSSSFVLEQLHEPIESLAFSAQTDVMVRPYLQRLVVAVSPRGRAAGVSMASRTIHVPALARVEGEGALFVRVRSGRVVDVQLRIYEPPRFFEAFLRGRGFGEAPDITARICGICPVAYQMSAVQAMEDALGVAVSPAIRALRRLLYCGEWIESHVLHAFLLHVPDFLGDEDALRRARDHPEPVQRALRLKKIGNALVAAVAGRAVHPINVRVCGFYSARRCATCWPQTIKIGE